MTKNQSLLIVIATFTLTLFAQAENLGTKRLPFNFQCEVSQTSRRDAFSIRSLVAEKGMYKGTLFLEVEPYWYMISSIEHTDSQFIIKATHNYAGPSTGPGVNVSLRIKKLNGDAAHGTYTVVINGNEKHSFPVSCEIY